MGMTGAGKNKIIMCDMDGFEGRSAGGGGARKQKDDITTSPAQARALYSVRWVQAPKDKTKSDAAPLRSTGTKPGEVRRMNMTMELDESGGNCAVPVRMSGKFGL